MPDLPPARWGEGTYAPSTFLDRAALASLRSFDFLLTNFGDPRREGETRDAAAAPGPLREYVKCFSFTPLITLIKLERKKGASGRKKDDPVEVNYIPGTSG